MDAVKKNTYTGIALATFTVIIWSGNFIIARGVYKQIPPVSLAFYRWLLAALIIFFLGYKKFITDRRAVLANWKYIFISALTGIALFNTLIYIAGHTTSAINLALIGTTSSPVFTVILSALFLKERVPVLRILGLLLCITGVVVLISRGSLEVLRDFTFTAGDLWTLLSAFIFAIYTILVKRKPPAISPFTFLFSIFIAGALLLLPFFVVEHLTRPAIAWNNNVVFSILYLGIAASVIAFYCWNAAIAKIGSVRTALFGNLIPVFSALEALWLLGEKVTAVHLMSGLLVITGLILANIKRQ